MLQKSCKEVLKLIAWINNLIRNYINQMALNQKKKSKLLMLSDTKIAKLNGQWRGFAPVVREIESLLGEFESITWIGYNYTAPDHRKKMIPVNEKIKMIALHRTGGNNLFEKIKILFSIPIYFFRIIGPVLKADIIYTRAPSMPSFIAMFLTLVMRNKKWWHKFAGNWQEENYSFFYAFQKSILTKLGNCVVSINGRWDNQPKHCFTFENPCISTEEYNLGLQVTKEKKYGDELIACFVGRLESAKGVDDIIKALPALAEKGIKELHLVGNGEGKKEYMNKTADAPVKCIFHDYLSRIEVFDIYKKSHLVLLPSKSEGFPKVIAEAANFGCVPIVSGVSAIPQYINNSNGFVWYSNNENFSDFCSSISLDREQLKMKSIAVNRVAKKFTYDSFVSRVKQVFKL